WGSAIRAGYDRVPRVFEHLRRTLGELFPAVRDAEITHRWGGPLGVPSDWHPTVRFDPATRIATAGGYVGGGRPTANLAGRTLADLLTGADTELTRLPWVGHRSPRWEPEPLRFLGVNAGLAAMGLADLEERLTRRRSVLARLVAPLVGGWAKAHGARDQSAIGRPAAAHSSTMIGTAFVIASSPSTLEISMTSRICSTVAP